jgi:hypothetical protein
MIPSGLVSIPPRTMFFELLIPLMIYQLAPSRERLICILRPMFVDEPISETVLETTEAVFKYVNIEPEMPRNVIRSELSRFTAPCWCWLLKRIACSLPGRSWRARRRFFRTWLRQKSSRIARISSRSVFSRL